MFPIKLNVLDFDTATILGNRLLSIINEIYIDYFSDTLLFNKFWSDNVFHESVVMKIAAYRFFDKNLSDQLFLNVGSQVGKTEVTDFQTVYLKHPIFYTRVSKPCFDDKYFGPILESQPHFDRAFDLYAFSFWLALRSANEESGGLCFFKNSIDIYNKFFVFWGQKNIYNFDLYSKNHEHLDKMLAGNIIPPNLESGQVYFFDSNVLHGATRPKTKDRISLDFRVILKDNLANADDRTKKVFEIFNKNVNFSNALNLITLGDIKGAFSLCDNILDLINIKKENLIDKLKRYSPDVSGQRFSWRDEYSFVDVLFGDLK